jgi:hypothetical protein
MRKSSMEEKTPEGYEKSCCELCRELCRVRAGSEAAEVDERE